MEMCTQSPSQGHLDSPTMNSGVHIGWVDNLTLDIAIHSTNNR
jgi:hypothetical protein